jgi:hypothetical protein
MIAPLVGMYFHPPAEDVVGLLHGDTELRIVRQPDNPHDPNACQVLLDGFCESGAHEDLFHQFCEHPGTTNPLMLGYIGAKTGHAKLVAQAMDELGHTEWIGELSFTPDGKPAVNLGDHDGN